MTEAEWFIMKVVWANEINTAQSVQRVLYDDRQWSLSTVKTLLRRLVEKGYLKTTKQGKTFIYQAVVDRQHVIVQKIVQDFKLICRKEHVLALEAILPTIALSQDDIQRLIEQLGDMKMNAKQSVMCQCAKGQCSCQCCKR